LQNNTIDSIDQLQSLDHQTSSVVQQGTSSYCPLEQKPHTEVLLATALAQVRNKYGQYVITRALLDSGSQTNFAAEQLVQ
jgi:hypothetical protein